MANRQSISTSLQTLRLQIEECTVCSTNLPLGPKPIVQIGANARLLIIGQAPGRKVHETGIPWDDASGQRLRDWLGLPPHIFYDTDKVALVGMGFCYPGKGVSGDPPPRPECAPLWHDKILDQLPEIELTLLIGQYAQARYLGDRRKSNLTETVRAWQEYIPHGFLPLVHPSPRNGIWLSQNLWFEEEVIPYLRSAIGRIYEIDGNDPI